MIDLKSANPELIVLDPQWFGADIIGRLVAYDTVVQCPPTGLLQVNDIQSVFPRTQPVDVCGLLTALELAVTCGGFATGDGLTATIGPDTDVAVPCLDRSEGPLDEWQPTKRVDGCSEDGKVMLNVVFILHALWSGPS